MVYRMEIFVDGGCRRNGYDGAIGAVAAILASRPRTTYEYITR
jgi:ribonuclease HI